jgi:serine protease
VYRLGIRVADARGMVEESNLLRVVEDLGVLVQRYRDGVRGGRPIDVLNMSLGYYHETPEDGLYTRDLYDRHGCRAWRHPARSDARCRQ